ncbi:hypothetical protein N8987_01700 [Crocinitomix sp.]|nr:hypothetical protein [Crocinitomix sp.]
MFPKTFFAALILTFVFISCKKEGCINENAANYDSEAKKDDGSCNYEASVSFWFNEEVADGLSGAELNIAMNEKFVGTMDATDWKTGPDCGGENYTIVIDLEGNSNESFAYSIANNFGMHMFDGTVTLIPNDCISEQLEF